MKQKREHKKRNYTIKNMRKITDENRYKKEKYMFTFKYAHIKNEDIKLLIPFNINNCNYDGKLISDIEKSKAYKNILEQMRKKHSCEEERIYPIKVRLLENKRYNLVKTKNIFEILVACRNMKYTHIPAIIVK